jgi:hypothetical protein
MVRRAFRRGLRLGLLIGALAALVKAVQSYRAAEEAPPYVTPPSPWPPKAPATEAAAKPEAEPAMEAAAFTEAHEPAPAPAAPRRERPLKAPPSKKPAGRPSVDDRIWVEPTGVVCPPSHPIKAKLSSKLFHLPGMLAYDRCKPDRCYATEAGAAADGLTRAKR